MATGITRRGDSSAHAILSGTISNGVTWYEDVLMTEDGTAISGSPQNWTWTMTFRENFTDDSAVLTLTTASGEGLTISQGASSTTLQIRVAKADLADLDGDYVVDLKSLNTSDTTYDSAGRSRHWAHGIVTVRNEP